MADKVLRPAIFLDRDGVLNVDKGYVHRLEDMSLISGVAGAVAALKKRGYVLIVISNQSGVARGLFPETDIPKFNTALSNAIRRAVGVGLDAFYYCPHHPEGKVEAYTKTCTCRKPAPGLIQKAAREHGIDLSKSFLVGDRPDDIAAGIAAGVTSIQVTATGYPLHPDAKAHVAALKDVVDLV